MLWLTRNVTGIAKIIFKGIVIGLVKEIVR